MSAFVTLSSGRICLRRWRDEDREAFAALNSDARVMEFFPSCLSRVESDAMVDRIEQHFSERGFGLWAIEVPDVAPFIGFTGLAVARFSAPFTPCVEVGWRLAFEHWGHGLCNGSGPISAWLWVWDSRAIRSRIFHIGDEPPLASSHGTAWDAP
jgi:RimJ/RimL family protein N-acetyltransferase